MELYDFQKDDVNFLKGLKSRLIANEMGTGKTLEAIELDRLNVAPGEKTLIVAPLSTLKSTWEEHYKRMSGKRAIVIDSQPTKDNDRVPRSNFIRALSSKMYKVYICNWEALSLDGMEELQKIHWGHVIADEAHRLKNRKTKQRKALMNIKEVDYRTAITGTPIMNSPDELWGILKWLYHDHPDWTSYWNFRNDFTVQENYSGYKRIVGVKNVERLKREMSKFTVRRTKKEVLTSLPDKYYSKIVVDLYPKQRKAYRQMKEDMITWLETQDGSVPLAVPVVIAQFAKLQQFAVAYSDGEKLTEPSSKIDTLMDLLSNYTEKKFVVFSSFKMLIHLVEERLRKKGIKYVRITGEDSQSKRDKAIKTFQSNGAKVFLGTIGAGSEGITLTAADTVVFLDRDWTPARNAQAEDRLHRLGQTNAVQVIDIEAMDTIDQHKNDKLEFKKEFIRKVLDT